MTILSEFNWPLIVTLILVMGAAIGVIAYYCRRFIKAVRIYMNNNIPSSDK